MWIFLSIYLSGMIVAIAIFAYVFYKLWYNGEPITLDNVAEITILPLFSWAAVLATVITYMYENSDNDREDAIQWLKSLKQRLGGK